MLCHAVSVICLVLSHACLSATDPFDLGYLFAQSGVQSSDARVCVCDAWLI